MAEDSYDGDRAPRQRIDAPTDSGLRRSAGDVGVDIQATQRAVHDLLTALGADATDDHLKKTPERVARAWAHLLRGESEIPEEHLEVDFEAPEDAGLIVLHGIPFKSTCAHHLLPFSGRATVAYRPHPGQRIVGLSKLARLVHGYAARLQVQERICQQVVTALVSKLKPDGAMCLITAQHSCLTLRGVEQEMDTTTEARRGIWFEKEVGLIHGLHLKSAVT